MINENLSTKIKNTNISLTAYRAIKILELLMKKPATGLEIIEVLKNDEITKRSISDDTLRISINSLRAVGCEIARPCPSNNYQYILLKHPFKASFSVSEITVLSKIRKYFLDNCQWKKVIEINRLYDKFIAPYCDEKTLNLLNYKRPFIKIKPDILETFYEKNLEKKEILMTYATSSKKIEKINISSERVFCEEGKLYISGWYYKRNTNSYFNAEKILEFHSIEKSKNDIESQQLVVIYKVTGDDVSTFRLNSDEKIICEKEDELTIECITTSEFKIIQRLLSFGSNFEIISPNYLKASILENIKRMKARYK